MSKTGEGESEVKPISEMNIFEKMSCITSEVRSVAKNLFVKTGFDKKTGKDSGYNAVSEKDILDAVKPVEAKYRVYSYPCARKILESSVLETETNYGKKSTFFSRIETTYRAVNIDKPEEYIETTSFAEGIDSQDKGSGKAMTYSDKYAVMKLYKLSTGDDPDEKASGDWLYQKRDYSYICEKCGSSVQPFRKHDGSIWKAEEMKVYSQRAFGRALCYECMQKEKAAEK